MLSLKITLAALIIFCYIIIFQEYTIFYKKISNFFIKIITNEYLKIKITDYDSLILHIQNQQKKINELSDISFKSNENIIYYFDKNLLFMLIVSFLIILAIIFNFINKKIKLKDIYIKEKQKNLFLKIKTLVNECIKSYILTIENIYNLEKKTIENLINSQNLINEELSNFNEKNKEVNDNINKIVKAYKEEMSNFNLESKNQILNFFKLGLQLYKKGMIDKINNTSRVAEKLERSLFILNHTDKLLINNDIRQLVNDHQNFSSEQSEILALCVNTTLNVLGVDIDVNSITQQIEINNEMLEYIKQI